VHSKTLAELAELAFAEGQTEILTEGFFWISLLLVSGFGIFWFYRLTVCLGMYDPLFIIPLMQACFILFGGVAGGIFFHEFHDVATPGRLLGPGNWVMYILGFAMVLYGLYLVAPKESGAEAEALPPTSPLPSPPPPPPPPPSLPTPTPPRKLMVSSRSRTSPTAAPPAQRPPPRRRAPRWSKTIHRSRTSSCAADRGWDAPGREARRSSTATKTAASVPTSPSPPPYP